VINSTFAENEAGERGGALASTRGKATITHCTFSGNRAPSGGGLFSRPPVLLRNTILAHARSSDCTALAGLDARSTNNLIVLNDGCGKPILSSDPKLEKLGLYSGPTATMPLAGGSPAINLGDNASAVDEDGRPLLWDQRGNGDPRVVAGFADIGAFEVQAFPVLRVNTIEDNGLRACSGVVPGDCSLRGALEIANAGGTAKVISFDPRVFSSARTLTLARRLPDSTVDLTLDGREAGGITVRAPAPVIRARGTGRLTLSGVTLESR
jgi:predicted outer membrane repeat protein